MSKLISRVLPAGNLRLGAVTVTAAAIALSLGRDSAIVRPPVPLPRSGHGQFSVATINLLTPRFETSPDYYPYVTAVDRQWSHRKPLLLQLLADLAVDVLCCQECAGSDPAYSLAVDLEALGYEAVIPVVEQRRGIEKPATFVRRAKFEVLAAEHRSRASLLALGCRERSMPVLFVTNVHLQGNPLAQDVRRSQLESACKRLNAMRQRLGIDAEGSSAVFCGDFNERPGTKLHHELTGEVDGFAKRHGEWLLLRDAYGDLEEPPATFRAAWRKDRIDFVYHSRNLNALALRWPLSADDEARLEWSWKRWPPWPSWLPSSWYPSDHLPLAALFGIADVKSVS